MADSANGDRTILQSTPPHPIPPHPTTPTYPSTATNNVTHSLTCPRTCPHTFLTHGTAGGGAQPTSATGIPVSQVGSAQRAYDVFNAFGGIVFAFSFSFILIEISDTLKDTGRGAVRTRASCPTGTPSSCMPQPGWAAADLAHARTHHPHPH